MKILYRKCMNKSLSSITIGIWIFGVAVSAILLLQLVISSRMLNAVSDGIKQILTLFIIICISFVIYFILNAFYERTIATNEMILISIMRKQFGRKMNHMEFSFLEQYESGNIFSMVTTDIENIGSWFQCILRIGGVVFQLIAGVTICLFMSWEVALVLFPVGVLATFVPRFFYKSLYQYNLVERETDNALNSELFHSLNFLTVIKSFCLEEHFIAENRTLLDNNGTIRKKIYKKKELGIRADVIVGHLTMAVVLSWGAFLILNKIITLSDMYGIIFITGTIGNGINTLIAMPPKYKSYKVSADRVICFLGQREYTLDKGEIQFGSNEENAYFFKNVTFSYDEGEPTLCNLNFDIKKGEKIAIVGQSGCGKSTLFKIMSGLYPLKEGNGVIELNNINIREMTGKYIKDYISIMSQDTYLFEDSIYNNIALFDASITLEEVRNVNKRLHIDDAIMNLSDGYDTVVARMQKGLSRGQIQRIGLARTLLQKKDIVLLDEPTAALDLELSKIVMEELQSLSKDKTVILISHKISCPRDFNRIMVIQDGEIAGFDHYDALVSNCKAYKTLLQDGLSTE